MAVEATDRRSTGRRRPRSKLSVTVWTLIAGAVFVFLAPLGLLIFAWNLVDAWRSWR
jgi:hypothetical protein